MDALTALHNKRDTRAYLSEEVGPPIHHPDVARSTLGIPDNVEPAMIVTLGWPAAGETPPQIAGPRLDLAEYAFRGRWPQSDA